MAIQFFTGNFENENRKRNGRYSLTAWTIINKDQEKLGTKFWHIGQKSKWSVSGMTKKLKQIGREEHRPEI